MSLADELRATLTHEADQRSTPQPDVGRLIGGGRRRRRRRTVLRSCVVAATVLACAAVYGVSTSEPTGPRGDHVATREKAAPPTMGGDRPQLTSGETYRVLVGRDATGESIGADFTVPGPRWTGGDHAFVSDGDGAHAGFGIYQPTALAAGSGCDQGRTTADLATTPEGLADQLATLPRSTVLRAPAATSAFDRAAVHLRLRIDVECGPGYYRVAEAPAGTRGISYTPAGVPAPDVVIDFWVLALGGRPVVVDLWHDVGASPSLVQQAVEARDSISIVVGG